ncbi:MAG: copper chaperone PCu(A)C [Gammaproteobacteria bacterium]|nr:copper chaperone PCu(A)C [Gammaproteobacteria bacterium]MCP4983359.1 copper chaperone PCu(A)C [Gammaproteobacteria bacterium]
MRHSIFISLMSVFLTLFALTAASAGGNLQVTDVWSRATPPTAKVGAAYFKVENSNSATDMLVGVASPIAERVEMHTHMMMDGMMMMHQLESVEVPANGTLEFKPGGNHIMLIGLEHTLLEGERFPLTLKFKNAGNVELIVTVRGLGG